MRGLIPISFYHIINQVYKTIRNKKNTKKSKFKGKAILASTCVWWTSSSCSASTIFIAIAIQIIQPQVRISIVFQPSIFWGNWDMLLSSEPFCCAQFIQKQGQKQWIPSFMILKKDNQKNQNYKIYLWRRKDSFPGFCLCCESMLQPRKP